MKNSKFIWIVLLLIAALLVGCSSNQGAEPSAPEIPVIATDPVEVPETVPEADLTEKAVEESTEVVTEDEGDVVYEGDASSYYIDVVYAEQIARYYTALSERWHEDKYIENGMSEVMAAYYEGNPLENVGFAFVDLDNDGHWELVIGAVTDEQEAPVVFEIWTLVDDKLVMLVQTSARSQYLLQYVEEDSMWYIANENSSQDSCDATYFLMLNEGKMDVMQGVIYNPKADAQNPWFMTYDLDWDASNDDPIDEDTAYAIREANRNYYTALEYFPYIFYK